MDYTYIFVLVNLCETGDYTGKCSKMQKTSFPFKSVNQNEAINFEKKIPV